MTSSLEPQHTTGVLADALGDLTRLQDGVASQLGAGLTTGVLADALGDLTRLQDGVASQLLGATSTAGRLADLMASVAASVPKVVLTSDEMDRDRQPPRAPCSDATSNTERNALLTNWQIAQLCFVVLVVCQAILVRHALPRTFAAINELVGFTASVLAVLAFVDYLRKR